MKKKTQEFTKEQQIEQLKHNIEVIKSHIAGTQKEIDDGVYDNNKEHAAKVLEGWQAVLTQAIAALENLTAGNLA